ncbi:hypothetical protein [Mycolicibacterium moriokaense]|uniref:Arsenate reductase n=1 Tax=Mycolicibacterium moriokaense TaxID=39691 RepID=A0A318H9X7_9MYCO|nr:hypothetical protein [Mycolicibacterium moriokaense]PXX03238.1 hypothetical protein C8E89_12340 [Mycolicibacterium moriokaense]
MATTGTQDWVPAACTLPTVEQPLRVAEFGVFFRAAVRRSIRTSTTRLDLVILREFEATARDLAERETSCCSFFRFEFHPAADDLVMSVGVPKDHIDVLDALHFRITTAVGVKTVNGDV